MKFRFFILVLLALLLTSCKGSKDSERLYLTSDWYCSTDSITGEYYPIDNSDFTNLAIKHEKRRGYIYLKTYFSIPEHLQDQQLACYLGIIKIADKAYINGNYIGSSGNFPPYTFSSGEIASAYSLPSVFLNNDKENELLLVLWSESFCNLSQRPFISTQSDVYITKVKKDFLNSKIFLIFAACLILVSFIYFLLMLFRPKEKAYLPFAGLTFYSAFYLITICYGEFPSLYVDKNTILVFEKIFDGIMVVLSTHATISFIRDFLRMPESKNQAIFRSIINIVSIAIIFPTRNLYEFCIILAIIYLLMFIHIGYGVTLIIQSIKQHNKNAYILLIGFTPSIISCIILLILRVFFNDLSTMLPVLIGWLTTIFIFLGILIYNLSQSQNNFEYLNKNLEKLVSDRTLELSVSNAKLEEINSKISLEKERAEKEIELASFVQQNFLPHEIPEVDNWELTFYSKAMAGVSGDLYDFYVDDKILKGMGIFDVSGHGISSGLVTMLVKNIIQQEFNNGKNKSLDEVTSVINQRVIIEKGNIENYLTGILIRVFDSSIEYVNAGHPLPYIYRINDNSFSTVDKIGSKRYGVIGISELTPLFETNTVEFESGDEILFYTDGITEGTNKDKIPFGRKEFLKSFKRNIIRPFDKQINGILQDFINYTETDIFNDDITLIILKKK